MDRAAAHAFGVLDAMVASWRARKMDEASLRPCLLYAGNTINEPFSVIIQIRMLSPNYTLGNPSLCFTVGFSFRCPFKIKSYNL